MQFFDPPQLLQMARTVEPPTHWHAPVDGHTMQFHEKWAISDRRRRCLSCTLHYTLQKLCTREHEIEGGH